MQKLSTYSLLLSLSLMSLSLQCFTVWDFNEKTIAGCIDDEIDRRLKPGLQDDAMKVEITDFKKRRKKDFVAEVEREHRKMHFKNEQDAKAYARILAKSASHEFFNDIAKKRIAMRMASLPKSALGYKDHFATIARTYIENKAHQESDETGCINKTLKNIDELIDQSLKNNFGWTCDVCDWLYNQ